MAQRQGGAPGLAPLPGGAKPRLAESAPLCASPSSWAMSVRPETSREMPSAGAVQARPPPSSAPKPVSASPPSWRAPTSSFGTTVPPRTLKAQLPSRPNRSRVTAASTDARPSTRSDVVRAQSASDTSARPSPDPLAGLTRSPRAPAAAMVQPMPASMRFAFPGVSAISPEPNPAAPQT